MFVWILSIAIPSHTIGIWETKAYLNGVKTNGFFSLRVLGVKIIATMCAVGSGLCCGFEGPMIHIGASCGYNLSQMKFLPKVSGVSGSIIY